MSWIINALFLGMAHPVGQGSPSCRRDLNSGGRHCHGMAVGEQAVAPVRNPLLVTVGAAAVHQAIAMSGEVGFAQETRHFGGVERVQRGRAAVFGPVLVVCARVAPHLGEVAFVQQAVVAPKGVRPDLHRAAVAQYWRLHAL